MAELRHVWTPGTHRNGPVLVVSDFISVRTASLLAVYSSLPAGALSL